MRFDLLSRDGAARRGRVTFRRGAIETPAFMPVGTAATVKAVTFDMVAATGAEIVLANTYHLMLRPGAERIARLGGLHRFMRWDGPILTDSGGYQVMSLAERRKLDEKGVVFSSHLDGSRHAWHVAVSKALGGHIFEVLVGNSRATTVDQILGGDSAAGFEEDDVRLGFNIVRYFGGPGR